MVKSKVGQYNKINNNILRSIDKEVIYYVFNFFLSKISSLVFSQIPKFTA